MVLAACWRDAPPPREPVEEPAAPQAMSYPRRPPPALDKYDEMLERMRGFTDQMCQCSDSNCMAQVSGELTTWAKEWSSDADLREHPPNPTDEQTKLMADTTKQLTDCMMRAMALSTGPQTPP